MLFLICVRARTRSQKIGGCWGQPFGSGCDDRLETCFSPTRLTMPILVILGQTIQAYLWRSTKDLSPHSHLSVSLQVTGTNTDRSAAMTSCTVSEIIKSVISVKNFPHPHMFNAPHLVSSPWNCVTEVAFQKPWSCPYQKVESLTVCH